MHIPTPAEVAKHGVRRALFQDAPAMFVGDRPFFGLMHGIDPYEDRPWEEAVRSSYRSGIRMFHFLAPISVAYNPSGYDWTIFDELHDRLAAAAPDALFLPQAFLTTPPWWDEKHPDERIGFRGHVPFIPCFTNEHQPLWKYETKTYHGITNPSLASEAWKQDIGGLLSSYVQRCWERHPGRFFAFMMGYGTCGEWHPFGSWFNDWFGHQDFSRPMMASFRKRLAEKYQSDKELRAAWKDPVVTLQTAEPPTRLQTLKADVGSLKNPGDHVQFTDWCEHYQHVLYEAVIHFSTIVKKSAPQPVLAAVFAGYRQQLGASTYCAQQNHGSLEPLLANAAVDILTTPNAYQDRTKGVFSQSPVASIARKKLFLIQNDVRTDLMEDHHSGNFQVVKTRHDSLNEYLRDTFFSITQGTGLSWFYDFGHGWYLDSDFEGVVSKLENQLSQLPPKMTQAEIAVVIDEESSHYLEGFSGYYNLFRKCLNTELPRMGAPFDVVTVDDLLDRAPYKLCLFRDMFYAPPARSEALRSWLLQHDVSCVWLGPAGCIAKDSVDPSNSRSLTGIDLQMVNTPLSQQIILSGNSALIENCATTQGTEGGSDHLGVWAPTVYTQDKSVEPLGHLDSLMETGAAIKRMPARFDAWFASPQLKWDLLSMLVDLAGVTRHVSAGDIVYGSGSYVSVTSDTTRTLRFTPPFPRHLAKDVLTGETFERHAAGFEIPCEKNRPRLLHLSDGDSLPAPQTQAVCGNV
ncbi:MAG: hypothetical protein EBY32_07555 [Proteobacteria bacterium]|nr:hypothetical protein [Pseudomonadota bacterium]